MGEDVLAPVWAVERLSRAGRPGATPSTRSTSIRSTLEETAAAHRAVENEVTGNELIRAGDEHQQTAVPSEFPRPAARTERAEPV
jgi:hypothetical protein